MHILIGLLTAIAGILWVLFRLQNSGVNLNSFNPFYWQRRRKWQQKLGTKPIHGLEDPMDAAAILAISMAMLEGELTREQKQHLIELFSSEFGIAIKEASEIYISLSHLLRNEPNIISEVRYILRPTADLFSKSRRDSLLSMLYSVARTEGEPTDMQQEFLIEVEQVFTTDSNTDSDW